jgi:hypothetical protein
MWSQWEAVSKTLWLYVPSENCLDWMQEDIQESLQHHYHPLDLARRAHLRTRDCACLEQVVWDSFVESSTHERHLTCPPESFVYSICFIQEDDDLLIVSAYATGGTWAHHSN